MSEDINKILARPAYNASSKYGSQMGRRNQNQGAPEALYLQRVRFVDGDYDAGGAYWGGGPRTQPLWCAFSPETTENEELVMVFVRAANREDAKASVLDELLEEGFTFIDPAPVS